MWSSIEINKNVVQPVGSHPQIVQDPHTNELHVYMFSGQAPMQRINSGIRVCPPDLLHFNLQQKVWKRMKQK